MSAAVARSRGEALERDIMNAYRPPEVYLRRTSPATRTVRKGVVLTLVVEASEIGCPDFHGCYRGRAVAFECKATSMDRWSMANLDANQAKALTEAEKSGCLTGIVIRFDQSAQVYWIPWTILRPYYQQFAAGTARYGDRSLTELDCGALGHRLSALRWWDAAVAPLPGTT